MDEIGTGISNDNNVLDFLWKFEGISDIKKEQIIRREDNMLVSSNGEYFALRSNHVPELPFYYVEITCGDCILLDFLLTDLGVQSSIAVNYTKNGLEAEFYDGKDHVFAIREPRSYLAQGVI